MNILLISEYFPYPPDNGAKIRIWNWLKALSQKHRVVLLTFLNSDQKFVDEVFNYCRVVGCSPPPEIPYWRRIANVFSTIPLGVWRRHSPILKKLVEKVVYEEAVQVVMVEEVWMAQYALGFMECYKVIDKLNIEFVRSYRRLRTLSHKFHPTIWGLWLAYWAIALRLRRYELNVLPNFNRVIVCSEKDAHLLRSVKSALNIDVIPNGVDVDFFSYTPENESENILVYTGAFDYEPNVDAVLYFVNEIMPIIRKSIPDIRFMVVGSNPPKKLLALMNSDSSIVITGYVNDVRPFIGQAKIFVAPLRMGSGTRLKILQAMAIGKPVVSTSIGCEGIAVEHGKHLLIADSPTEFAGAVIKLLQSRDLRQEVGEHARRLVCERYTWQQIQLDMLKMFDQIEYNLRSQYESPPGFHSNTKLEL